jgi:hypothetical protein
MQQKQLFSVSDELYLFIYLLKALLKRRSRSASWECELPEYHYLRKTFAKRTSEVREARFGHP